jgi:protein SCO1/2
VSPRRIGGARPPAADAAGAARSGLRERGKFVTFAAALVAAMMMAALPAQAAGASADDPFPVAFGGPFTLVDQTGATRTDADFRGRFMLVYFGYTTCPDICPTDLQVIADALDRLGPAASRVQPVFVTVDPGRDTPAVLRDYLANFRPDLIGLTGSEAQIGAAAKAYKVHRVKVPMDGAAGHDDYLVNHSATTYLMGPDGRFVTLFPHGTGADAMAARLATYVGAKSGAVTE